MISDMENVTKSNSTEIATSEQLLVCVILILIALSTAFGNSLVVLSVALVKKLQTPSNFLIVSLAVSDFLVSLCVMPFATYSVLNKRAWNIGELLCDAYTSFDVLLCTSSILNLCAISVDRYLAITKPLQYASKRTPKRMLIMILTVWSVSALISVAPVFGFKEQFVKGRCEISSNLFYQIYATLGAFYLPLIVMIVLYIRILKLARKMAKADLKNSLATRSASEAYDMQIPSSPNHAMLTDAMLPLASPPSPEFIDNPLTAPMQQLQQPKRPLVPQGASLSERYPLPPSSLARRRHPRPLHRLSSYTNIPNNCMPQLVCTDTSMGSAVGCGVGPYEANISLPYVDQSVDTAPNVDLNSMLQPVPPGYAPSARGQQQAPSSKEQPQSPLLRSISMNQEQWAIDNSNHVHMYKPKNATGGKVTRPWQNKKLLAGHNINNNGSSNHLPEDLLEDNGLEFFVGRRKSSLLLNNHVHAKSPVLRQAPNQLELSPNKRSSVLEMSYYQQSRNPSWVSLRFPVRRKRSRLNGETKAIKTLGIIMGCFCLCWIPFFIIAIVRPIYKKIYDGKDLFLPLSVEDVFQWLGYFNSTLNPLIYALFNLEFRVPFKELIMCRCRNINARLRSERFANEYAGFTQPSATTLGGMGLSSYVGPQCGGLDVGSFAPSSVLTSSNHFNAGQSDAKINTFIRPFGSSNNNSSNSNNHVAMNNFRANEASSR